MRGLDLSTLDPGIRETVAWLRGLGYETTDSGDGKTKVDDDCAMAFPNVAISIDGDDLRAVADRLSAHLRKIGIAVEPGMVQMTYDPANGIAVLLLTEVDDSMLP